MGVHLHPRYTDAEALAAAIAGGLSKVIWKDADANVLNLANQVASIGFTDLDLTAVTSANAKFAIVSLRLHSDISGTAIYNLLGVRKNGTAPTLYPAVRIMHDEPDGLYRSEVGIIGLDSGQVIEYHLTVATNGQVDARIDVLGYIE